MPQRFEPLDGVDGRPKLVVLGADEHRHRSPARLSRPGMDHKDTPAQDEVVVLDLGPEFAGKVCGAAFRPPRREHFCCFRLRRKTSDELRRDHPLGTNLVDVGSKDFLTTQPQNSILYNDVQPR